MDYLISKIVATLALGYDRDYIHWRDHAPRKETKARALAEAEAWESLSHEERAGLSQDELLRLGIEALHRCGYPPLCYDDNGGVYVLFPDGRREYDGRVYRRWIGNQKPKD